MRMIKIYYHSAHEKFPISELDIHPEILDILEELGILEIRNDCIDYQDVRRLYRMMRLKEFQGVNFNGAAIIVDLLQRIEELEEEIDRLKREVK